MRDVNRIDYILDELKGVWKRYPDLRLGQLLLNVVRDPQLYQIEDEDLIEAIRVYYK